MAGAGPGRGDVKRVLMLTRDLPPGRTGGVASWVDDVARALTAHGREVHVLVEHRGLQPDPDRPYATVGVAGRSWKQWQGVWMGAAALPRLDSDTLVLGASWRLVTALARLARGGVVLAGAHGSDLTRIGADARWFRQVAQRIHLLPVSEFLAERARALGAPAEQVHTMTWPLSLDRAETPGRNLAFVARLVPGKGLRAALVLAHRLGRRLVVVGDGPIRAREAEFAERHGIDVDWRGALPRREARAVLRGAAAVLLLSEPDSMEGLGLTALEAAAAGVPAIGRDVGGVPEAVGPGLLLPRDAQTTTLDLDPIRAFLADGEAGRQAQRHVRSHHAPEAFIRRLDAVVAAAARP